MQLKKIILGLVMTTTVSLVWAEDTTPTSSPAPSSESSTPATHPAVILPQDDNSIDAAPDDNEFDLSPSNQASK